MCRPRANRTKVGLKHDASVYEFVGTMCANRTKVGLKREAIGVWVRLSLGANRTKVGLKLSTEGEKWAHLVGC